MLRERENVMEHLGNNAPIVEAILYLEFNFNEEITLEKRQDVANALSSNFPIIKPLYIYESSIELKGESPEANTKRTEGWRGDSQDGKRIFQIMENNLSYSILKPYTDGDELINEYEKLWSKYSEILFPKGITKIGLRNINKFSVPASSYKDFFKISPNIHIDGAVPLCIGFSSQNYIVMSPAHENAQGNINVVFSAIDGDKIEIIFDIDVFKPLNDTPNNFDLVRGSYQNLRTFKNSLFSGNITQKTLELFNER